MKTLRRDVVKKMIESGKMIGKKQASYIYGETAWMPVKIDNSVNKTKYPTSKDGFICLNEDDFTSRAGHAWLDHVGQIILYVHGNLRYTLKPISN